jgi:hypothetical protein
LEDGPQEKRQSGDNRESMQAGTLSIIGSREPSNDVGGLFQCKCSEFEPHDAVLMALIEPNNFLHQSFVSFFDASIAPLETTNRCIR